MDRVNGIESGGTMEPHHTCTEMKEEELRQ